MKHKKIVDVRETNVKLQREWEFAQANYSEADWLMANFHSTCLNKVISVKSIFKDWYGDWIEFQIGLDEKGEAFSS